MNRYRTFMDGVRVSGALHQRLSELEKPGKRPAPWKKYGAMAAALLLVCGLGGYGAWAARANGRDAPIPPYPAGYQGTQPEQGMAGGRDIAPENPGESVEPAATRFAGRYEVTRDGVTTSYLLPYIIYGETDGQATAADWDVPPGAVKRDLTQEDIAALMGGEDVLSDHLAWGEEYALSGWAAWYGDGSFWGAYINGLMPNYGGAVRTFEFAVTAGQLPPTCVVYPNSAEQNISGVSVTAGKYDWEESFGPSTYPVHERRVSFLTDSYGYRFEMSSGDPDLTEELVSRLVRRVIDGGVAADRLSSEGAVLAHPWEADPNYSVGEPNYEDGVPNQDGTPVTETCPDCGVTYPAGEAHYHTQACGTCGALLPADGTHHSCGPDPAGGYLCRLCGERFPAGKVHSHELCVLPPAPTPGVHTCEVCGESYVEGTAHSHACPECGEELPAGQSHDHSCEPHPVYTCGVCGQTLPAGVEHSHQEDHHQEGHHSEHH